MSVHIVRISGCAVTNFRVLACSSKPVEEIKDMENIEGPMNLTNVMLRKSSGVTVAETIWLPPVVMNIMFCVH